MLFLASAETNILKINKYSAWKCRPCPTGTVYQGCELFQELPWTVPGWQAASRPSLHTHPCPPSPGIILPCPLSPSRLPSSFLNLCSSDLLCNTSSQICQATPPLISTTQYLLSDLPCNTSSQIRHTIPLSTPTSLLAAAIATSCCTQDQLFFTFDFL
jgi:hypothetical protein